MSQRRPAPDVNTLLRRFVVEAMTGGSVALLGASERNDQVELRAAIDHPANAAQNSIHFSKCPKSVDVNRLQTGGLRQQFLVCHSEAPDFFLSPERRIYVGKNAQRKLNHTTCAPEKYSLRSCSCIGTKHFARSHAYEACDCLSIISTIDKFQFVAATPDECAATTGPAPLIPVVAAAIHGEAQC